MFVILFLCIMLHSSHGQFCPQFAPECTCNDEDSIECKDFDSFSQLIFSNPSSPYINIISVVSVDPKNKIILDGQFTLNGLRLDQNVLTLKTSNLDGFQIGANPFQAFPDANNNLEIKTSNFDLFDKQNQIITDKRCDLNYLNSNQNLITFFSLFSGRIIIDGSNSFTRPLCTVAFYKTKLDKLLFLNINQTANQIRFANEISNKDLLCNIKEVEFRSSKLRLNSDLINSNLFKNTELFLFSVSTEIVSTDATLFANFKQLKQIVFELDDLQSFIKADTQWFANLANNEFLLVTLKDNKYSYDFPESDFCDVASFPSFKRVFARIESKINLTCTCSLLFLVQNWKSYLDPSRIETDSVRNCLNQPNFDQLIANCEFETKTKSCFSSSSTTTVFSTTTSPKPNEDRPNLLWIIGVVAVFVVFIIFCCCCCKCCRNGFEIFKLGSK
jgi:hypothetical protein